MPFVRVFDDLFDEDFQCEVSHDLAAKLRCSGAEVTDDPMPGVPVQSRYRSDRHPGWADVTENCS